ncbi:DUF3644 domain-containing protein [Agromyces bauzanensis]|uniref:DUF3644 domain-containing protein n=1 Tax=Agromyces bauzanensis TaxID=1308924 RepID=A0A917PGC7_9MICO|nr:DUF3644 domain-containing protein [Agromyces bauzanensis]GGJ76636.1 hypothetical protein GCM10011372_13580 [Agromyces bauzanensis]
MGRPPSWRRVVLASQGEAAVAVRLYNEPTFPRALEAFVVHMHLAWLYLLQAEFVRDKVDFRFPDPHHKGWFEKVDGEHKTWDLSKSVRQRWPDGGAVRTNLEFFIQLRNRVEHRHAGADESMFEAVAGKSHAFLLNYEEELTQQFGNEFSMAKVLRFPVFIGTFTEPAEEALTRLQKTLPADLHRFLAEFDAGLSDDIRRDSHYNLRLRVLLEASASKADMAIQFDRYEDLTDDQRATIDQLGQSGRVIVRQQDRPVSNQNLHKPSSVIAEVADQIPFVFNSYDFSQAWKKGKVRPESGATNPKRTKADFCVYDTLHRDYGYTDAYVAYLVRKCSTAEGFRAVVGREPRPRVQTE